MAELPGWDRGRLATAPERDVEAARLLVYARARAPEIRRDIEGDIRQVTRMGQKVSELDIALDRRDALRELTAAKDRQADLRRALELDEDDD